MRRGRSGPVERAGGACGELPAVYPWPRVTWHLISSQKAKIRMRESRAHYSPVSIRLRAPHQAKQPSAGAIGLAPQHAAAFELLIRKVAGAQARARSMSMSNACPNGCWPLRSRKSKRFPRAINRPEPLTLARRRPGAARCPASGAAARRSVSAGLWPWGGPTRRTPGRTDRLQRSTGSLATQAGTVPPRAAPATHG